MKPLELIELNPTLAESRELWMVMSSEIRDALLAKQSTISTSHQISPIELTDGRFAVCCDLISEIKEGGVFRAVFATLDLTALDTCEIVDTPTFKALLPEPEPLP